METDPESCSCSALRQAGRHVTRLYDDALGPVGLSLNQYSILSKLTRHGPQSIGDLSRLLVMDRSTLGHLLRPLERSTLLTIGRCGSDKRQRLIALTQTGTETMRKAKLLWCRAERRFERSFGEVQARQLRTLMRAITELDLSTA